MAPTWSKWVVRVCFALVFAINVSCALQFIFSPSSFAGAYELQGTSGNVAVQGIGIAFLMWNATYPLFIVRPDRYRALGVIIIVQQAIGCIGESALLLSLPQGHEVLAASILRFIAFDGAGLVAMVASLSIMICFARKRMQEQQL